jgi:hypothetical protein
MLLYMVTSVEEKGTPTLLDKFLKLENDVVIGLRDCMFVS